MGRRSGPNLKDRKRKLIERGMRFKGSRERMIDVIEGEFDSVEEKR